VKHHLFFILLCCAMSLRGQTDLETSSHFMKDSMHTVLLNIRGNYFFGSDAITNEFASHYYLGKFIDDDLKNNVSKNLSPMNHFGGQALWDVSLTFHPDTGNNKVEAYIAYRSRFHSSSGFPKDFFEIFFRGNKMFAGETADLSNFSFQQFSYKQFVVGIGNEFSISGNAKLYVGANLAINRGNSFLDVTTKEATLYTAEDGEFIYADLHASIQTDDSSEQHPSNLDGSGYSGDFYIEYETEKSLLSFSVENYGSIQWNKWSTTVNLDSSFTFEGIEVRDLFDIEDSVKIRGANLDSMFYQNYVHDRKEERVTTMLPMKISGFYRLYINPNIAATVGMDVLLHTNASNRYYAEVAYKMNRTNQLGITVATGGYTTFHMGLGIVHWFPWNVKVEVGSHYLYPMITYKSGKSQGAYLSLSKSF
jgi:hypothetical protein